MRLTGDQLEKIKEKYGVDRLWSFSRFSSYCTSTYEYFLHYIKGVKEDRTDSIYPVTGGLAHNILEKFYGKEIKYEDMDSEFEDAWTTAMVAELKFDRSDADKNKKISDKYYKDLKHFFSHHVPINHKVEIERFVSVKVGNNVFQGYIDTCYKDDDGNFVILDWKTSTKFTKDDMIKKTGQLVIYAMALHEMGVPYEKIKICFDFLKYVDVDCLQANGKWTTRTIERFEIGNKLQSNAKMWLNKLGYSDNLVDYLENMAINNDVNGLPNEVKEKFVFHDCVQFVDLTQELIDYWTNKTITIINEIIQKENEYETEKILSPEDAEKIWYDNPEDVEKESYYFGVLCGYSANLHKPYGLYLEKLEKEKNEPNLFGGLGSGLSSDEKDDMEWLNQL